MPREDKRAQIINERIAQKLPEGSRRPKREAFLKALSSRVLLLDGPTGTELEKRGVDTSGPSWTAFANIYQEDAVREVHQSYITSGADIITANTFRTNERALKAYGRRISKQLTRRAVMLARSARSQSSRRVFVAGSIAPVEDCFTPELVPSDEELEREHRSMVLTLDIAKVDLILIETMNTLREAAIALRAARSTTELPVLVSLVPKDGQKILSGERIKDAIALLTQDTPDVLLLNCAPLSVMIEAFPVFKEAAEQAQIPFGIYPNASEKVEGRWDLQATSDEAIVAAAKDWVAQGASIVGSCCGTTPQTTDALHTMLSALPRRNRKQRINT